MRENNSRDKSRKLKRKFIEKERDRYRDPINSGLTQRIHSYYYVILLETREYRAIKRKDVSPKRRRKVERRSISLRRSFLLFPEKRRPRSLGLDSDSLAARSSGKFNYLPLRQSAFISLRACIYRRIRKINPHESRHVKPRKSHARLRTLSYMYTRTHFRLSLSSFHDDV